MFARQLERKIALIYHPKKCSHPSLLQQRQEKSQWQYLQILHAIKWVGFQGIKPTRIFSPGQDTYNM